MEDTRVTFETAKLAKEKGFKIPTTVMYKGNEKSYGHNNEWGIDEKRLDGKFPYTNQQWYSIPTQSFLQKWLREEHNIHLIAYKNINIDGYDWCYITTDGITNINSYKTYEEALEVGLQEALKLINNK